MYRECLCFFLCTIGQGVMCSKPESRDALQLQKQQIPRRPFPSEVLLNLHQEAKKCRSVIGQLKFQQGQDNLSPHTSSSSWKKNPSMSTMSHDEMEYNLSTFPLDQDEILFSQLYINSFIHHLTTVTGTLSVAGTVCVYFMYFMTLFIIVVCPVPFCSPAISCFSRLLFVRSGFHHSSIEAGSLFVHCYVRSYVWSTFMFRSMLVDKGLLNRTTLILNCICKTWIAMNCNYKYTFVLHAN